MSDAAPPAGRSRSAWRRRMVLALAVVLIIAALLAPSRPAPALAWVSLPAEGIALAAVLLALRGAPRRWRRIAAWTGGVVLGLVSIIKILNVGFLVVFGRGFDPFIDWTFLRPAAEFLLASVGRGTGIALLALTGLLLLALPVLLGWSVRQVSDAVAAAPASGTPAWRRVGAAWRAVALLACLWIGLAALGSPLAGANVSRLVAAQSRQVVADLHDRDAFALQIAADPYRGVPTADLLTALRGRDVLLIFVESYGRVALTDPTITDLLGEATGRLHAAGFDARSAFLRSSTAGGASWLAHSTLQSGLWVDSQLRYDTLLRSDRLTLTSALHRAGWRTLNVAPADTRDWPEGLAFYDFDELLDSRTLGYRGPPFAMHSIPDQYTLSVVAQLLAEADSPMMIQVDLLSGHAPWRPVPPMLLPDEVGDGSSYVAADGSADLSEAIFDEDPAQVRADYLNAMRYTLDATLSFVERLADDPVIVMLGDHQPFSMVAGADASREVPLTILARDPAVLDRTDSWGFTPGLIPGAQSPSWPMDAFRDRFFAAFSGRGGP